VSVLNPTIQIDSVLTKYATF